MIDNLTPPQAWEFLKDHPEAKLIEVRTRMEYAFVGHSKDAAHIPWKEFPDWQVNDRFLDAVREVAADPDTPLLLLCRSGQRSLDAARVLEQAGYRQLINVLEGFEGDLDAEKHRGTQGGWRFHGLPWEQS